MDTKDTLQKTRRKDGQNLAYRYREGQKPAPVIIFLGGYQSDMTGTKASYLDQMAEKKGLPFLRFDYRGHGASDGVFRDLCLSDWLDDARTIIDTVIPNRPIIGVGSSMGGWIGLLLAKERPEIFRSFIGIAAAPDFTEWVWQKELDNDQRALCKSQGYIGDLNGSFITLDMFKDGAQHLIFPKPLPMPCPVTLLQGKQDTEVPYPIAEKLAAHMTSPFQPDLILIEDGDHRLSRPQDLELLGNVVGQAIQSAI